MRFMSDTDRSQAAILARLVEPGNPNLSPDAARSLLQLEFPEADRQRMNELAAKARAGTLVGAEAEELDDYLHIGHLLALLQAKARASLKKHAA